MIKKVLKFPIGFLIATMVFAAGSVATEYSRLVLDLDGDGNPEIITASTFGEGDFQNYVIRVGTLSYTGQFFAVDGEKPIFTPTQIGYPKRGKQILVETFEAASRQYTVLSFHEGRLVRLLEHESRCNDGSPRVLGNGQLEVFSWNGFWSRPDRYTLNSQGPTLEREARTIYPVGVSAFSSKTLTLKPADCKSTVIPSGTYIVVENYDVTGNCYLIRGLNDACGWIPEDKLSDGVKGLPGAC